MSYGKFSLVASPNTFFNGTQKNDFVLYHTSSNNSLVIGVPDASNASTSTNAMYISSSNVNIGQTLVSHSLLSPTTGTLLVGVAATVTIPINIDPTFVYNFLAIGQTTAHSALVCNASFISALTVDTSTTSAIQQQQLTITNNTTTPQTYTWSLTRVM